MWRDTLQISSHVLCLTIQSWGAPENTQGWEVHQKKWDRTCSYNWDLNGSRRADQTLRSSSCVKLLRQAAASIKAFNQLNSHFQHHLTARKVKLKPLWMLWLYCSHEQCIEWVSEGAWLLELGLLAVAESLPMSKTLETCEVFSSRDHCELAGASSPLIFSCRNETSTSTTLAACWVLLDV